MIKNDIKFDFDDLLIIPKDSSDITSRQNISIFDENYMLPLFTAPMDTVVGIENVELFIENKIVPIIPRGVDLSYCEYDPDTWIAYGLKDYIEFINNPNLDKNKTYKILIDIANGNMKSMHDLITNGKSILGDKLILMVGNVANPETYRIVSELGADYCRIGVGNGGGCFLKNTKVITKRGIINIQDVIIGDEVLTHTGKYKRVYNTISYETVEELIQINFNISTLDHEYYVLNKKYLNIVNDNNIEKYAEWVEANKLSDEYFLLENVVND